MKKQITSVKAQKTVATNIEKAVNKALSIYRTKNDEWEIRRDDDEHSSIELVLIPSLWWTSEIETTEVINVLNRYSKQYDGIFWGMEAYPYHYEHTTKEWTYRPAFVVNIKLSSPVAQLEELER